jgi:CMP-N,N'-diacetyllegionaminic acid synthase
MKILGVIPARGGSKGVPRKNIKLLAGKPLIAWTIEAALNSNLTRVVLSTEDEEIAQIARKLGVEVPFMRPPELAIDSANQIPGMQWVLNECEKTDGEYDAIMMLQPTAPMKISSDINSAIEMLEKNLSADAVISLTYPSEYPERMKYIDEEGVIIDPPFCEAYENQSRQELKPIYQKNGSIYLTRRSVLIEKNSFKGAKCLALIVPESRSINIDTPFQFMIADLLMKTHNWKTW